MAYVAFPCGCQFKLLDDQSDNIIPIEQFDKFPRIDISLNPWDENSIHKINLNCDKVWDMLCEGKTKGVFQLETSLGKQWAKKTQPSNLEDLSALGALLRPGCLLSKSGDPPKSMTQRYADRKLGKEEVTVLHKEIENILDSTYQILCYQEQSMQIAEKVAGFNKQEADILRKAIGKKKADVMAKVEKDFIDKAEKAGIITVDEAKEIFSWIKESQKYSFNKCLSRTTILETQTGLKTIEDIDIGDKILAPSKNGNIFVDVVNKYENGEKELYEIQTESGKTIQCSIDHKFLCEDGFLYPLWEIIEKSLKIVCQDD
jgi:DNA polymerase-3 subunit alpha